MSSINLVCGICKFYAFSKIIVCFFRDTLFFEDFVLSEFIEKFLSMNEEGALVPCYQCAEEGNQQSLILEVGVRSSIGPSFPKVSL